MMYSHTYPRQPMSPYISSLAGGGITNCGRGGVWQYGYTAQLLLGEGGRGASDLYSGLSMGWKR